MADIRAADTVYVMTQTIETLGWRSVLDPEAPLSSPDSDGYDANQVRQRPIRIADGLWDDYGIVAEALDTDRSAAIRDFIRWMTYDETVDPPRRPDIRPKGLRYVALPPGIQALKEGEVKQVSKPKTRYLMQVDATPAAIRTALIDAGEAADAQYLETSPVQVSTFDREHSKRIRQVLLDAGLTVVNS